jgi:glycogen operon protein
MATLMVSMGIPMITAGDEIGRTQQGNNNAYCQDNPITWLDWTSTPESHAMLRSTKRVIRLRKEFLAGQPHHYPSRDKQAYLHWFDEHGKPMSMDQWNDPQHRVVQLLLGSDDGQVDGLVVVNGSAHDIKITLPDVSNDDGTGKRLFELRLTTSELHDRRQGVRVAAGERDVAQSNTISIYRT